jgi:serine/threonine protein kinase
MADADWANYKQLRGKALPERIEFRGAWYRQEKHFKRDFYAATGLYRIEQPNGELPEQIMLKIYHTEPLGLLPLGWLGRRLCNREVYWFRKTEGISGLARMFERFGASGFVREYVPGCDLREYRKADRPNEEFYPRLYAMLTAIHARGIAHNDLSKPENILVRSDGTPAIIDFQIAGGYSWRLPLLKQIGRRILRYMQSVDRYHLRKLHRRDRPQDFTPEELKQARKKGIVLMLHGWLLRKPYRAVRHFILNRFMRAK